MGIHNFKSFLSTTGSNALEEHDSIFIDIQSYLYKAIQCSFKSTESELVNDICLQVVKDLQDLFEDIFSYDRFHDTVKVLISFDGESLPMKFPTQKQRRNVHAEGKNMYKLVLYGHNTISHQVCHFIIDTLTHHGSKLFPTHMKCPSRLEFSIMGSNTKGEGEHKLFSVGTHLHCRRPVIASVDNDVFIIALSQLAKFDTIQIYKSKKAILNVNQVISQILTYDKQLCIAASLLFGNDFIPPIIHLSDKNCPFIHEALKECHRSHLPHVFRTVLNTLKSNSKIIYVTPPQIDETIVLEFWKNCFWVLDYYEKYHFPQKFMENNLFDLFEKNHLVTALLDEEYSEKSYRKATATYRSLKFPPLNVNPKDIVFTKEQLKVYGRFFPNTEHGPETFRSIHLQFS